MSEEEKKPFEDKYQEALKEWEKQDEEYKSSLQYKKYQSAMNRISGSGKSKKPVKKVKKKEKKGPKAPEKPANMPKQPPPANYVHLWKQSESQKGVKLSLKETHEAWAKLGAEAQKPFMDQAKEVQAKYEADMKEFCKSVEGKKYLRLEKGFKQRNRINAAKEKINSMDGPKEPKKPPSAWILFGKEKGSTDEFKGLDLTARAKKLQELWNSIPAEEKQGFEKQAAEAKAEYDKELLEYKNSDAFKSYSRAVKSIQKKPKKAAPKATPKPKAKAAGKKAEKKAPAKGKAKAADSDSDDAMGSVDSDSSSSSSDSDSD